MAGFVFAADSIADIGGENQQEASAAATVRSPVPVRIWIAANCVIAVVCGAALLKLKRKMKKSTTPPRRDGC